MSHFAFLASIVLFCLPGILVLWKRDGRLLKRYELVILIMMLLCLPFTGVADYYALHWHAWQYVPNTNSDFYFFTLPEIYLFAVAVTSLVGAVTLIWANRVDRIRPIAVRRRASRKR